MGGSKAGWILVILAIAWLRSTAGVKDHVAALNETSQPAQEDAIVNEVSFTSDEMVDHPHRAPGKPSKLDLNVNQMIHTDDESEYQIEASRMENATASPGSNGCQNCEDPLKRIDDVVDSQQAARQNAKGNDRPDASLVDKARRLPREHVVKIRLSQDLVSSRKARTFFNAFGLKKLLLPLIFGVQIIKSVLLALFLPSIIGSIGNILGKGVSSFAQSAHTTAQPEENFEFKDNSDLYNDDYLTRQPVGTLPASAMYDESMMQKNPEISSRYSFVNPSMTHANAISDRYYTRHVAMNGLSSSKKQDFKVFHEIPTSSLMLTNYDPFYSPLLSRLDAVFSRLGHTTEGCREYTVCAMYRSPARYAPYSNLVSAQLSRELNELRRPSSDNPDVLRFFRYMKAAKDGQDGIKCEEAYTNCATARNDESLRQNQAILATYQDIDKLVHARKL
ncbi:protein Osi24 isoform X2 [Lasioglossum baleicum]|uniref:protein Osi24 isoform X2 n=1 Tax=Lasioglossum baleicum TaxID=434251 RepID=UPI003FCD62DE